MTRLFFSLLVLTCLFGMAPVQAAGAQKKDKEEKPEELEKPRVLLLDLEGKGVAPETVEIIYDLVATQLSTHKEFDVITSQDLRQLATLEVEKQKAGCGIDESCLAELAGAMGTRYVVYGKVGLLGKKTMITLNLFDSVDAKSVAREQVAVIELDELTDMMPLAVTRLMEDKKLRTDRLKEEELPQSSGFPWLRVGSAAVLAAGGAGVALGWGLPSYQDAADKQLDFDTAEENEGGASPTQEDVLEDAKATYEAGPAWGLWGGSIIAGLATGYGLWVATTEKSEE